MHVIYDKVTKFVALSCFLKVSSRPSVSRRCAVHNKTAREKEIRSPHYFLFCIMEQSISSDANQKQFNESKAAMNLSVYITEFSLGSILPFKVPLTPQFFFFF